MPSSIPHQAQTGFANASTYDTHRPSYPPSAVTALLTAMHLTSQNGARVIDLAAGTGKFTELLAKREEGFEILAIEPHEGMRKELDGKGLEGVKVVDGIAAEGGLGDVEKEWAEGVVVAQAFHWFANEDALHEIYRVLAPGGSLGMIWNIEDYNAPLSWKPKSTWEGKMKDIIWSFDDDQPRFRHEKWRDVFDKQAKSTPFTIQAADPLFSLPLGEDSQEFTYWLTRESIWERFHTLSHIAVLEGGRLEDCKRKAFEAMNGNDVEVNEKGELALHGHTIWVWTTAIPGAPLRNGG